MKLRPRKKNLFEYQGRELKRDNRQNSEQDEEEKKQENWNAEKMRTVQNS